MRKSEWLVCLVIALALGLPVPSLAEDIALVEVASTGVHWNVQRGDFEQVVLTVALPNGDVIRQELEAGEPVVFDLDAAAEDGVYTYELRGIPRLDVSVRRELAEARKAGNEADVIQRLKDAGRLPREAAVQSGTFLVLGGAIVSPDLGEERPREKSATSGNDVQVITGEEVIADDLIVQGGQCVGIDCTSSEIFGNDTILLKENNLRIHFDDTSSQVGFPANDWHLIANDSASGGSNKFSIEDSTSAKTPFTITAGAATNSIFVDSTGRVGLRTSTPVLDLHINTSNTPAIRLEQNNSGGFTAQTWDIGANEANFFIRDVTGGSRLPFRIRAGAPTSSLDISSDGDVGIGTASPSTKLHVVDNAAVAAVARFTNTSGTGFSGFEFFDSDGTTQGLFVGTDNQNNSNRINTVSSYPLLFMTNSTERMRLEADGDVGIGTTSPDTRLDIEAANLTDAAVKIMNSNASGFSGISYTDEGGTVSLYLGTDNAGNFSRFNSINNFPLVIMTNSTERIRFPAPGGNVITAANGASLSAGGTWTNASSRANKKDIVDLDATEALAAIQKLDPVKFQYKTEPGEQYIGFIAEDVPELVATNGHKSLSPMDVVAVLTKVVQEQQKTIDDLSARLAELENQKD